MEISEYQHKWENLHQAFIKSVHTKTITHSLQVGHNFCKFEYCLCLFINKIVIQEMG